MSVVISNGGSSRDIEKPIEARREKPGKSTSRGVTAKKSTSRGVMAKESTKPRSDGKKSTKPRNDG